MEEHKTNPSSPFLTSQHLSYILSLEKSKDLDSIGHYLTEHLRVAGGYWSLCSLSLFSHQLSSSKKDELLSWLQTCQNSDGGFGGNTGHDSHITSTHYAVLVFIILGGINLVKQEEVVNYIVSLQNSDGSFNGDVWGEKDTRFSYCALACLALLGRLEAVDVEKACDFVLMCRNFDGAFGGMPDMESHAAYVFCCVG